LVRLAAGAVMLDTTPLRDSAAQPICVQKCFAAGKLSRYTEW
jgi:hypothetical protein